MEYSLNWGLSQVGLPLIVTTCTDDAGIIRNLCFLIDTGSTDNILFNFVYEHFQKSFKPLDERGFIMGFDGKPHETLKIEMTFNFENKNYTSLFSVLSASDGIKPIQDESGIQIHGILGIPFLYENEWILNFEKFTIGTNITP